MKLLTLGVLVRLAAAVLSGTLVALSFPEHELWPLAWVAFLPVLWAISGKPLKSVFFLSLATGLTANALGFFWMNNMLQEFGQLPAWLSVPLVLVGSAWQGIPVALAMTVSFWLSSPVPEGTSDRLRHFRFSPVWTLPVLYAAFESAHPILFPWFLGNGQYRFLALIQVCDLVGVPAVTFLVVMGNAFLFVVGRAFLTRQRVPYTAAVFPVLLFLSLTYGVVKLQGVREEAAQAPSFKMGVLEPEIDIFEAEMKRLPEGTSAEHVMRYSTLKLQQDSRDLQLKHGALDLVLWPETCYFPTFSAWVKQSEPDWISWGPKGNLQGHGDAVSPLPIPSPIVTAVSSSAYNTFVLTLDGTVWTLDRGDWVVDLPAGTADLTGLALDCSEEGLGVDSPLSDCVATAQDRGGTTWVRQSKGVWQAGHGGRTTEHSGRTTGSPPPDTASASRLTIPFTRQPLWLPPDVRRLDQSHAALPDEREFPDAVLADLHRTERETNAVQRDFALPLLFGAVSGHILDYSAPSSLTNQRFNSAFLVDKGGMVLGRYDKQYLLAFGEYIPFGDVFPVLYDWIPAAGRSSRGPNTAPVPFRGRNLGVLICYEDILPEYTRKLVAKGGVDVLLNLTNDAWFGKTQEPKQHFVLALFRSIEHRRSLVRSTTNGISGAVAPSGDILALTDLYGRESFVVDVPLMTGETFYQRGGHWFPQVLLLISLALVLVGWWRGRSPRRGRNARSPG